MSKAFLKESDSDGLPTTPMTISPLPPGTKNYLTPAGAQRLRDELTHLVEIERPRYSGQTDDSEARQELQRIDARVRYVQESLRSAEVTSPPPPPHDVVHFGASVEVRDEKGTLTEYRLVGVDETDLDRNWVSWLTPIARALLNRRVGEKVIFTSPRERTELQIIALRYE
ncbi:MAG TPA: GreA/GreB family elongation factor [Opitutaceae bacterium]|nr:GreA/GreB family elongation factor [Opitutaceae bacterium]